MQLVKNKIFISIILFIVPIEINHGTNAGYQVCVPEITEKMADFTPVLNSTFKWEGGYQAYPTDRANYTSSGKLVGTNRGISAIAYEDYLGREPSVDDIKAITPEIARAVYKKLFWDKMRGDEIKNQNLAEIIFASYIGNISQGNKIMKNSLAKVGHNFETIKRPFQDEVLKAINRSNPEKLFYVIKEEKRQFIESLRYSKPEFYNGWIRKVNSFEYEGKKKRLLLSLAVLLVIGGAAYYAWRKGWYTKAYDYSYQLIQK
jgi:lysozyme family protein